MSQKAFFLSKLFHWKSIIRTKLTLYWNAFVVFVCGFFLIYVYCSWGLNIGFSSLRQRRCFYSRQRRWFLGRCTCPNSKMKLLFFYFWVINPTSKNENLHFELPTRNQKIKKLFRITNSMDALLFSHLRVTIVKLINEQNSLNIIVSKWHGLDHSVRFFLYLACFVVSTYVIFIWVS